ncbi:MAG: hypothetical protein ACSLEN_08195 [Candidatus Malihini olakiniferum]
MIHTDDQQAEVRFMLGNGKEYAHARRIKLPEVTVNDYGLTLLDAS